MSMAPSSVLPGPSLSSRAITRRTLGAHASREGCAAPHPSPSMHRYRTHTCGALREDNVGESVRLSGWCHRIRDHGGVLFIDLRDHYGLTQCVADPDSPAFKQAETVRSEWVVRIDGKVRKRPPGTENRDLRSEEHTSELQSRQYLVCRLLLEKKNT